MKHPQTKTKYSICSLYETTAKPASVASTKSSNSNKNEISTSIHPIPHSQITDILIEWNDHKSQSISKLSKLQTMHIIK